MSREQPSVDELRTRLRELGYLDAGMDRFVLGPVRASRSLLDVAWRAAVRIGVLAGLLLGPSSAVMAGVRLPGLVTGLRDAVVLAAYLGVLFAAGTTIAAFTTIVALGYFAERTGRDASLAARSRTLARAAGVGVTSVCLAYLVLWWQTVSPAGTVWTSMAWTLLVLALATTVSMLLGHAVMVSTLALAAREAGAGADQLKLPARSWWLTIGLGLATFAAGAALLFVSTRGDETAGARTGVARLTVSPTPVRTILVAVDGFDLAFADRLAAAGRLPHLSRVLGGARMSLPPSDAPDPARTWTSLATGQPATVHGVSGIEARRVSGLDGALPAQSTGLAAAIGAATDLVRLTRPSLTTGLQRRSKTFWEVAAEQGVRTLVVNWWATWPAPDHTGTVLSDRATLRLDRGGVQDAEIAPPALYEPLRQAWPSLRDAARTVVIASFPKTDDTDAAALRRAAEQDAVPVSLALKLAGPETDAATIYLPGLDIAQYTLLGSSGGRGLPASVAAARVEGLEAYYAFLDRLLAPLVDLSGPGVVVGILSDPGRAASRGPGVLALAGGPALVGFRAQGAAAEVMPTLLYLLGLPASRELPGRPRTDLFEPAFVRGQSVRVVDSYGRRPATPRPSNAAPLDQEMMDRLRSLGYVR